MDCNSKIEYKYLAFISYTTADLKIARRLKRRIQSYHLPAFMRKDRSKKHISVFMADQDFNEHTVLDGLHKKLNEAEYLVVVCSPDSAKAWGCTEEVSYFIQTGRADHIIPYIISGQPNSHLQTAECYPEPLRALPQDQQINGIYTPLVGQYKGYLMVMSRMFHLEYDAIRIEDWKRRIFKYTLVSIVALVFLASGLFAARYFTPHYQYYADYVDKDGIAEGIIPLDRAQREHRPSLYKFEYRQNKLVRTTFEDSYGNCIEHNNTERIDRPSIREFQYTKRGGVEIVCKNSLGQTLWVETVSPNKTFVGLKAYDSDQGIAIVRSLSDISSQFGSHSFGFDVQNVHESAKSTIRGYLLTLDDGYVVQKLFTSSSDNTSDEPGHDANGIEGLKYELDSLHRVTKITYINADGEIVSDRNGISSKSYYYDGQGNLWKTVCTDKYGQLTVNEDFWAVATVEFDRYGRHLIQRKFNEFEEPTIDKLGVSVSKYKWNDRGLNTEQSAFNEKEEPVNTLPNNNSVPIAHRIAVTYNNEGRVATLRCYNKDGDAIKVGETLYYYFGYDKDGHMISRECRDAENHLTYGGDASAIMRITYFNNNPVRQAFYGTDGHYVNTTGGFAYIERIYDNYNRLTREEYFNKFGNRVPHPQFGNACGVSITYKERTGNIDRVAFLDASGNPAPNTQGLEIVCSKYNNLGLCTEERNISKGGNLHYLFRYEFDGRGNRQSMSYYNEQEKLAIHPNAGFATQSMKYNKHGQIIEIATLDCDGQPLINNQGWAIMRNTYDKSFPGPVTTKFFNESGEPIVAGQQGTHELRFSYLRGQLVATSCYDVDGSPMLNTVVGAWKWTVEYSQYGYPIRTILYDIRGNRTNGNDGFCEQITEYSDAGWLTRLSYLDKYGHRTTSISQGYSSMKNDYLYTGLMYMQSYYDESEWLTDGPQGYATLEMHYDSHFNLFQQECYDADGRLVLNPNWNAVAIEAAFDPEGQCVYQAQIDDEDGSYYARMLVLDTLGYPRYAAQNMWGDVQFSDGISGVEFEIEDYEQLNALIDARIRYYKKRYAESEGIEYLFD